MDDADVENVEDTLTILNKYVESMDIQGKKNAYRFDDFIV